MEIAKRTRRMIGLSLISACPITSLWVCWGLIFKEIPSSASIIISKSWTHDLAFEFSYLWTILLVPICVNIFYLTLVSEKLWKDRENKAEDILSCLIFGVIVVPCFSFIFSLIYFSGYGLIGVLSLIFGAGLACGYYYRTEGGLLVSSMTGLLSGLISGFQFGLVALVALLIASFVGGALKDWTNQ